MTTMQEFRCEVCGLITTNPTHWFVIRYGVLISLCTGGILKPPTPPEPCTTAAKLTPRYTSVAGLNRCAHRRSQILPSTSGVRLRSRDRATVEPTRRDLYS